MKGITVQWVLSKKTVFYSLLLGCVFLGSMTIFGGLYLWSGPAGEAEKTVVIPLHSGTIVIGEKLEQAGIIRSAEAFRVYAILTGAARRLKAGEYAFAPKSNLAQVVRKLETGEVVRHAVTIPEGYTMGQIAQKLEQAGLVSAQDFLTVGTDARLVKAWEIPGRTLEGFLFPDTYQFTKGMTARQIAKQMVGQYRSKLSPELIAGGKAQGADLLKLTTMASIIEREVRAKPEQPVVASVFYNRMKKRKRLESCATVLYSQGRISGALSLEDLETQSPYNTYRHRGLPPGPIGNPGLNALRAAAFPAQTEYLFFVVRPDGTHVFSETFEEHKRAKWKQKRARRRQLQLTPAASQP